MTFVPDTQQIARQIERIVRQSGGLATLPELVAQLLTVLNEPPVDPMQVARLVQADAALCARVLSLAAASGTPRSALSLEHAIAQLSIDQLRYAALSAKVFQTLIAGETSDTALPRRQLALHSLATACVARALAEWLLPENQRDMVYLAALLHDIGKVAFEETMPKSYQRLVEMAKQNGKDLYFIEQQQLGLDHSALGKRLSEKWLLPESIGICIWLHHTDTHTVQATLAEPIPAAIVALADRLARQANMGQSGSYGALEDIDEWRQMLGLRQEQIQQILTELPSHVGGLCQDILLPPSLPDGSYVQAVQHTAIKLAQENQQLEKASHHAQQLGRQNELIEQLLADITEHHSAADIAERFCLFWKTFASSPFAAAVIFPEMDIPAGQTLEMAVADRSGQSRLCLVQTPTDKPALDQVLAQQLKEKFEIVSLDGHLEWLVAPIAHQVNPDALYVAPLAISDRLVGLLIFERNICFEPRAVACQTACRMAAFAIRMALSIQKHTELCQRFLKTVGALRAARTELARAKSLQSLAEMAAGAAHEINTPLAVISGKAQLLADTETDPQRQQMLQQIIQRSQEISTMISQLLTFAKPPAPTKKRLAVQHIIEKALEKAVAICPHIRQHLQQDGQPDLTVFVDPDQIASALSEILINAIQSYPQQAGDVWITCQAVVDQNHVGISVRDQGCGMDAQILQKVTDPFYSHRSAGRRRGMGLTVAQRLVELNGGHLIIHSVPEKGTTVTVQLPVG